jgi:quercetin dioxygenase-like cupin family protein
MVPHRRGTRFAIADAHRQGGAPRAWSARVPAGHKHDPITHQGETVGYVIEGQLELTIDTTAYVLSAGDSFFFKSHLSNSYRNIGTTTARVLWVNTPQVH